MLKDLVNKWFNKQKITDDYKEVLTVKVWNVISGPYSREEVDDPNLPEELGYMLVCLIEVDGELTHKEYWFSTFEDASVWIDHFKTKIEPLEVRYG